MSAKNTSAPTPWTVEGSRLLDASGRELCRMDSPATARRIVVCVNACARIPTLLLEKGIVWRLIEKHADALEEEIPELKRLLADEEPYH